MECRVCEFTVPQFGIKKMHGGPDMDEFIVCLKGWKLWYSSTNNFKEIKIRNCNEFCIHFPYIKTTTQTAVQKSFDQYSEWVSTISTTLTGDYVIAKPRVSRD